MKKAIFILITIIFAIAFARGVEVSVSSPHIVKTGNEFTVYVAINNVQNFYAADLSLHYNSSALQIQDIYNGSIDNVSILINYSLQNGVCRIVAIAENESVNGSGYIAALRFLSLKEGIFNITVKGNLSSYDATEIQAIWRNATIVTTSSELKVNVEKADEKFIASINLTNTTNFYSINFTLLYDDTFLSPLQIENDSLILSYSIEGNKIKFAGYMPLPQNITEENLVKIVFQPMKNGFTSLNLANITASDSSANEIYVIPVNSSFLIAGNIPPIANFSWQPSQPTEFDTITFNASLSYDPDGYIINYTWDFGDGTKAYGEVARHKYDSDGIYIVNLTVIDNDGAIAWKKKEIEIINIPPVASFNYTPLNPTTADVITFDASASYDSDGNIINYTWET